MFRDPKQDVVVAARFLNLRQFVRLDVVFISKCLILLGQICRQPLLQLQCPLELAVLLSQRIDVLVQH